MTFMGTGIIRADFEEHSTGERSYPPGEQERTNAGRDEVGGAG